jgi:uncharacterized membrane protein
MNKSRVEAFSDGVMAIIVTIMVLEMKVPHDGDPSFEALKPLFPIFLSYILSFTMVLIYWNNHHHMYQSVKKVNGRVLLANGFLLFWLSLMPFTTAWMGENHFASIPVALFGTVLFFSGVAYSILVRALITAHGENSTLAKAVGNDFKGWISLVGLYDSRRNCFFYAACFMPDICRHCYYVADTG